MLSELTSYTVPPSTRHHTQTTQSYQPRVLHCPSQHQTPYSNYTVISTSRPTLSLPAPDTILKLHSHINLASYTVPPSTRHHTQTTQSYQPHVLHCPSQHQTPYSNYTVISTSRPTLSLPAPDTILKLHSHINLASYTVPPSTRHHTQTTQSYQPHVLHCPSQHQTPYSNYTVISTSRPTLSLPAPDTILKLPSHINLTSYTVPPSTRHHTQSTQSYQPHVLHCPSQHQTPYSIYPVISTSRPTLSLPAPDIILKLPSHINLTSYTVPPSTRHHTQTTQSYQPHVLHCPSQHQTPYSNYPVISTSRPTLSLPAPDTILKLPSHINLTSYTVPPSTRHHTQTTQSYQPHVLHCPSQHQTPYSNYPVISTSRPTLSLPAPDTILKLPSHINLASYTVPPTTRRHTQTTQSYQPRVLPCPSQHQTPYSNYPVISTSRPTLSLPPPDTILNLPSHINLTSYTVPSTTRRLTQTTQSYQPRVLHCPSHHQTPYSNYTVISTSRPTLSLPPPDAILKLHSHINLTSCTVPPTTRRHTQTTQSYQPRVLPCPSHHQTPYSNYPVISTSRPTLSLPPPDAILKLPSHINLASYTVPPPPDALLKLPSHINLASYTVPPTTRHHTQTTQSYQPHVLHCPSHHQTPYSNYTVISTSRPALSLPAPDTILKLPSHINLTSYTVPPTTRRHTQTTQSYLPRVLHCPFHHQTPYSNYPVISTSRPTLSLPPPDALLKLPSHINLASYTVPPTTRHHTQTTQSYQPHVLHCPSHHQTPYSNYPVISTSRPTLSLHHQTPYSNYPVISTSRPTLSLPPPDAILKLPSHIYLTSYTVPPTTRYHTQTTQSYQPHVLHCPSHHQTPYSIYPVISTSRPTLSLPAPDTILKLHSHINLTSYTVPPSTRHHTQTTQSYQPRVLHYPSQHQTPYSNYPVISTSRPALSLPAPDTILKLPSHINLTSYTVPPTTRRHTQTTQSYQPRVLHCPSHHQTPYSNYTVISTSRPTLSLPPPDAILKLHSHINLASYTVPSTTRRHTQTTVISTSRPTLSLPPPDTILNLPSHINLTSYTVPPTTRRHTQTTQSYQPHVLHCPSQHQTPYSNYTVISTSRPTLSLPAPDTILKLHSHINLASYTIPPSTRHHTQTIQSYQPHVLPCPSQHQTPYSNYPVISTSRPTLSLPPPDAILKLPSHINLASYTVPPTTRRHTQTTQSYQPRVLPCPSQHQTPYSNYPVISTSRPTLSLPPPDTILNLPSHINLTSYTVPPSTRHHTQTTQSYQPHVLHCPSQHQTPYSNYTVISTSRPTLSLPAPDTILKLPSHINLASYTIPPSTRHHTQTIQSYQPHVLPCPSQHQTPYSNYPVISTSRPTLSLPPPDAILKLPSHINLASYTVPPTTRRHTQTTQSYQPRVLPCPSQHQTPYSNYPVISTSRPTLSLPPPDTILNLPSHINLTSYTVPPTTRHHTQTTVISTSRPTLSLPAPDTILKLPSHCPSHHQTPYQPHVLHCPSHHQTPYSNYPVISTSRPTLSLPPPDTILILKLHQS